MTVYQVCWYFITYAFVGWVIEVVYHAVVQGKVVNRGFLNGPVCPIYGVGMLGVIAFMNAITPEGENGYPLGVLFVGGMVFATFVELAGGWLLDKLFHTKWWDYSDKPFNFRGYICLQFSILWGMGIVLVMDVVHPLIEANTVQRIPEKYGWFLLAFCYVVFVVDVVLTVIMLNSINRRLAELEQLRTGIRTVSDGLTNVIAGTSMAAARKIEEGQVQAALGKAEFMEAAGAKKSEYKKELEKKKSDLQKRMDELSNYMLKARVFGYRRILKAFPDMISRNYDGAKSLLKEKLKL